MKRPPVQYFSVTANINSGANEANYTVRYRRSHDVRAWLKTCLKDPDVTSVVITIAREAKDPVENPAS